MDLKVCDNGHFYDASCYSACPLCTGRGVLSLPDFPEAFRALGEARFIGRGSTSEVYRISGGQEYALKMIPCGPDEEKYRRSLYELDIMKSLAGIPQAVQLCGSEVTEDDSGKTVWLLEEYQRPFSDFLSDGPLRVAQALELLADLCGALTALSRAGIAHLDVQPKNLFCTSDGNIKLGDFSSSLFLCDMAENRGMRGTLAFMAPETYREGLCGEQSDVYSTGLILYALFNQRRLPFAEQGQELAVYKRLAGTPFPNMAFADSALMPELMDLVRDACAFDPARRLRTAAELEARLTPLCRRAVRSDAGYQILPLPQLKSNSWDAVPPNWDPEQTVTSTTEPPAAPLSGTGPGIGPAFDADSVACTTGLGGSGPDAAERAGAIPPPPSESASVPAPVSIPGYPAASFCRTCGAALPPGGRFCQHCGAIVSGPDAASISRQPISPAMMPQASSAMPAAPSIEPPQVNLKQVQFSAVAPKSLVKGDYSMIDIVMYEEGFRSAVDELIANAEEPVKETRSGFLKVADNATVRICLASPDLEIEDNEETRVWQGGYLDFSFAVMLPEQYKKRQVLFTASVYINDLIATKLKFVVKCFSFREQKLEVSRADVFSAFISYASQDRNRVATIIQGMKKARPDMDIFFDVDSLRSGEDWERALHYEIEKRDTLFLCWSHNARASKWVDAEWRYAMDCKGADCIEPVPLDPPNLCPPPEELSQKHFNDKLLYIINSGGPELP